MHTGLWWKILQETDYLDVRVVTGEANIATNLKRQRIEGCRLDSSQPGFKPVAGCCDHTNNLQVPQMKRFLDYLRNISFLTMTVSQCRYITSLTLTVACIIILIKILLNGVSLVLTDVCISILTLQRGGI